VKRAWVIVLVGAVGALGAGVYFWRRANHVEAPRYETVKLERGRLVAKVTATGTLSATVTVLVGSQVSGRIAWLGADYNSKVKKGQVIARIDRQLYEASVEQARANYSAAQGNLLKAQAMAEDARRQADRAGKLFAEKLIAAQDSDTAASNAKAADANVVAMKGSVEQARASLHQNEINLELTTITSPVSGVVISRSIDVGQTVAASLAAPTLFTIAEDLSRMQVDTNVAEADVGKVEAKMDVTFTVDAFPNKPWKGKVRQIRNAPLTVQNVVTYDAVIDVENPELKLRPGMTANVTFVYADKADVLRVPNAALRFKPPGDLGKKAPKRPGEGKRVVWRLDQGAIDPVPIIVSTGVTDGTLTELVGDAIAEGAMLVTESNVAGEKSGSPGGPGGGRRAF